MFGAGAESDIITQLISSGQCSFPRCVNDRKIDRCIMDGWMDREREAKNKREREKENVKQTTRIFRDPYP